MEITKPTLSDADALVSLWMELADGQREYGSHLLVSENQVSIRETIGRHIATGRVFVAHDGSIQGFVTYTVEVTGFEQDVTRGIVENLYVCPDNRNDGLGTALLEAAERDLAEKGVDVIALEAMAANDDARAFYRSHGYSPHRLEFEKTVTERDR